MDMSVFVSFSLHWTSYIVISSSEEHSELCGTNSSEESVILTNVMLQKTQFHRHEKRDVPASDIQNRDQEKAFEWLNKICQMHRETDGILITGNVKTVFRRIKRSAKKSGV